MNRASLLRLAAILLYALGVVMVYLGFRAGIWPPTVTGIGFFVIATVFYLDRK